MYSSLLGTELVSRSSRLARNVPVQVVRSSGRISKEVPILLIGDDLDGTLFSERTKTVVLSLRGAGLLSKHKLSPEQELVLRWPECNKEAEIRVVGQLGTHKGLHIYGVAFIDAHGNFWGMEFPPLTPLERQMGRLLLVCNSCQTIDPVDDDSMEADFCLTNRGVMRFCKGCNCSTLWKPARTVVGEGSRDSANRQMSLFPPASPPPFAQNARESRHASHPGNDSCRQETDSCDDSPSPRNLAAPFAAVLTAVPSKTVSSSKEAAPVNRRKHPRVKVKYSACIRHAQRGEEIVLCEDMSKGGLRFKSRKQYFPRTLIEVAAPYHPGQPAIFVAGQIVFVEELKEQQLFRHGVHYLKPAKPRDGF